jgi:hypothetical protein
VFGRTASLKKNGALFLHFIHRNVYDRAYRPEKKIAGTFIGKSDKDFIQYFIQETAGKIWAEVRGKRGGGGNSLATTTLPNI